VVEAAEVTDAETVAVVGAVLVDAVVVVVVVVVEVSVVFLPNNPPKTASHAINSAAHCRMA